jgi:hypothetical protein
MSHKAGNPIRAKSHPWTVRGLNPTQESYVSTSQTGIAVTAKIFFLNFLTLLFKPIVEIDGEAQQGKWSTTFFPTAAGQHSVTVYWKYFWVMPANKSTITVTVEDGATTNLTYQCRWMIFLPGKMTVTQAVPAAA